MTPVSFKFIRSLVLLANLISETGIDFMNRLVSVKLTANFRDLVSSTSWARESPPIVIAPGGKGGRLKFDSLSLSRRSLFFSSFFSFFSSFVFVVVPDVLGSSSLIDPRLFFSFFFGILVRPALTYRDLDLDLECDLFFLVPRLFLLSLEDFATSFSFFTIDSGILGGSTWGGIALSFLIVTAMFPMVPVGAGGYVGIINCPQFVVAGLIILDDLLDCKDVLPFFTTSTLEAILGRGGLHRLAPLRQ